MFIGLVLIYRQDFLQVWGYFREPRYVASISRFTEHRSIQCNSIVRRWKRFEERIEKARAQIDVALAAFDSDALL